MLLNKENYTFYNSEMVKEQIKPEIKITVDWYNNGIIDREQSLLSTIIFTADDDEVKIKDGPVILLREETSPDDINGMNNNKRIII